MAGGVLSTWQVGLQLPAPPAAIPSPSLDVAASLNPPACLTRKASRMHLLTAEGRHLLDGLSPACNSFTSKEIL